MKPAIIIYGAKAEQEVKYGERLAEFYGAPYNFCLLSPIGGHVYFSYSLRPISTKYSIKQISFAEAAAEYNAAIPLTDWQSGPPPAVGEWNTSNTTEIRRWWNGRNWSIWYAKCEDQETQNCQASLITKPFKTKWRGLSKEPIIIESE